MFKKIRRVWAIAGTAALLGFLLYTAYSFRASAEAREALHTGDRVRVEQRGDAWLFEPLDGQRSSIGLLFLPGSLVDPAAYAPLARAVAGEGFPVTLLSLPWRMFGPLADPDAVFDRLLTLTAGRGAGRWVLGGHSRGGALAADYASRYSATLAGLLLIGTSHPREADLSRLSLPVLKIYGSRDGLATVEEVQRFAAHLPLQTRWVELAGANHAQFGWYGSQLGDGSPQISREEQQARTVAAVLQFLREVGAGQPG